MIVVKSKGEIQEEASLENVKKTSGIEAYNKPICDALSEENNEALQEVDTVENWINRFVDRYDYGTKKHLVAAWAYNCKFDKERGINIEEEVTIGSFHKRLIDLKMELIKYGANTELIDRVSGIVENYIQEKSRGRLLSKLSEEQKKRAQEMDIVYKLTSSFAVSEEPNKALERWFVKSLGYDIFEDKISIEFLADQLFRIKDRLIGNGQDAEWVGKVMDKLVKYVLYGASNRTE